MSLKSFVMEVRSFSIFKNNPLKTDGKDVDLFIETRDFLNVERAVNNNFGLSRCFYNRRYPFGVKRRYITYDRGKVKIIDLGINAWYNREREILGFDLMKVLSRNKNGLMILDSHPLKS